MTRTKRGNPRFRTLRSKLRSQMTSPEQVMWTHLRSKQFNSLKFRRQHGIGDFIVDFYCPEKHVVIEIDGDTHAEEKQIQLDKIRESYLKSLGVRIIRYCNYDIMTNIEGVLEDLWKKLLYEVSTSPPPPYKGGD